MGMTNIAILTFYRYYPQKIGTNRNIIEQN